METTPLRPGPPLTALPPRLPDPTTEMEYLPLRRTVTEQQPIEVIEQVPREVTQTVMKKMRRTGKRPVERTVLDYYNVEHRIQYQPSFVCSAEKEVELLRAQQLAVELVPFKGMRVIAPNRTYNPSRSQPTQLQRCEQIDPMNLHFAGVRRDRTVAAKQQQGQRRPDRTVAPLAFYQQRSQYIPERAVPPAFYQKRKQARQQRTIDPNAFYLQRKQARQQRTIDPPAFYQQRNKVWKQRAIDPPYQQRGRLQFNDRAYQRHQGYQQILPVTFDPYNPHDSEPQPQMETPVKRLVLSGMSSPAHMEMRVVQNMTGRGLETYLPSNLSSRWTIVNSGGSNLIRNHFGLVLEADLHRRRVTVGAYRASSEQYWRVERAGEGVVLALEQQPELTLQSQGGALSLGSRGDPGAVWRLLKYQ